MKRFCPKCGKEIDENNMIHNFCIDCYLEDHDIIKVPKFKIIFCPKCGSLKYARKVYQDINILEKQLSKHIKVKNLKQAKVNVKLNLDFEKKKYFAEIIIRALIGNKIKTIKKKKDISLKIEVCKSCSRLAGNFFTTILQIRFDTKKLKEKLEDRKIEKIVKKAREINSRKKNISNPISIVDIKDKRKGVDVYINSLRHANAILEDLKSDPYHYGIQHTKTLTGVDKNGKRRYRYTICIHFKEK